MGSADSILKEIEEQGAKSFIPIIGPKKGKILDNAVLECGPQVVLEVGTLIGYSAIRMARLLPEKGRVISIERDRVSAQISQENIARADLAEKIKVLVGDARNVIPELDESFDFVFLDAEKSEYLTYLELVEEKLHGGSVIVADNAGVFAKEMSDYLTYVRDSGRYQSRYYESTLEFNDDIIDGVEVSLRL